MYTGTKLSSSLQIKGKTKFDHKQDLAYYLKFIPNVKKTTLEK